MVHSRFVGDRRTVVLPLEYYKDMILSDIIASWEKYGVPSPVSGDPLTLELRKWEVEMPKPALHELPVNSLIVDGEGVKWIRGYVGVNTPLITEVSGVLGYYETLPHCIDCCRETADTEQIYISLNDEVIKDWTILALPMGYQLEE